jgi:hypothetical protein
MNFSQDMGFGARSSLKLGEDITSIRALSRSGAESRKWRVFLRIGLARRRDRVLGLLGPTGLVAASAASTVVPFGTLTIFNSRALARRGQLAARDVSRAS